MPETSKSNDKSIHEQKEIYNIAPQKTVGKSLPPNNKGLRSLVNQNKNLQIKIQELEKRVKLLEALLPDTHVVVLRAISRDQAKKEITNLFVKGETLYYSDIAEQLDLDLELVVDICSELQQSGEIEVDDEALRSK
jgi:hypothetical protein